MKIYVVNMGRLEAANYHVGFVTTDFNSAVKFISEHLVYGDDAQWCRHIYNRVSDMEVWENEKVCAAYGNTLGCRINQIGEKESLTVEEIEEDIKKNIRTIC